MSQRQELAESLLRVLRELGLERRTRAPRPLKDYRPARDAVDSPDIGKKGPAPERAATAYGGASMDYTISVTSRLSPINLDG